MAEQRHVLLDREKQILKRQLDVQAALNAEYLKSRQAMEDIITTIAGRIDPAVTVSQLSLDPSTIELVITTPNSPEPDDL
jgi:hypothetical protein